MPIRLLTSQDAAAYRSLRLAALAERPPAFGAVPEDEPDLELTAARLQETPDRCFLGAVDADDTLVGILRLSRYSCPNEKHRAYLAGVYVSPGSRRQGWGRALVQAAIDRAKSDPVLRRLNLTVVAGQTAAIGLYESFGFVHCGTDPDAFSCDGVFYDEWVMTLHLAALR